MQTEEMEELDETEGAKEEDMDVEEEDGAEKNSVNCVCASDYLLETKSKTQKKWVGC